MQTLMLTHMTRKLTLIRDYLLICRYFLRFHWCFYRCAFPGPGSNQKSHIAFGGDVSLVSSILWQRHILSWYFSWHFGRQLNIEEHSWTWTCLSSGSLDQKTTEVLLDPSEHITPEHMSFSWYWPSSG